MENKKAVKKSFAPSVVALILLFCVGALVRLLPYGNFITPEGVYFLEGDNYEHLRKILVLLEGFPGSPAHDYYAGFPVGSGSIWAPLFDITMAQLVKISGILGIGFEKACALLPPFVGMTVIVPVFLWSRQIFGAGAAFFSVLILVFLPAHISMTTVGRLDNELIEPLFAGLLFYFYSLTLKEVASPLDKKSLGLSALTGFILAVSLLFWRGALIWWAIIALHAFLLAIFDAIFYARSRVNNIGILSSIAFVVSAIIIAVVTMAGLWGTQSTINFNTVGWFHVISALLSAIAVSSTRLGYYLKTAKGKSAVMSFLGVLGAIITSVIIAVIAVPAYFSGIFSGMGVIGGTNPWTRTIAEYQPLFRGMDGGFDPLSSIAVSTAFIFIFPIALAYLTIKHFKEKNEDRSAPESFFILAGWAFFVLTIINGRYENVFAVLLSMAGAFFVEVIAVRLLKVKKSGDLKASVIGFLLVVIIFLPSYGFFRDLKNLSPFGIRGDMEEGLQWLRDNTPATSHFLEPYKRPEYGVMARWEYGGWIEYVARRPSVATLFGIETHGLIESAGFFLETDATKALSLLDENNARYVIITKDVGALPGYAKLLGRDPAEYVEEVRGPGNKMRYATGPKFLDLVYVRLLLADGQSVGAPIYMEGVPGARLVHESVGREDIAGAFQEVKKIKIFERVNGAFVRAPANTAGPGEIVTLEGTVVTNRGRRFSAVTRVRANETGGFEIRAYYPTLVSGEESGLVGVEGGYTLSVSGRKRAVVVNEDDVVSGAAIDIGFVR